MYGKAEMQNYVSENEDFLQLKCIREHWKMITMRIAWYIYKKKNNTQSLPLPGMHNIFFPFRLPPN